MVILEIVGVISVLMSAGALSVAAWHNCKFHDICSALSKTLEE